MPAALQAVLCKSAGDRLSQSQCFPENPIGHTHTRKKKKKKNSVFNDLAAVMVLQGEDDEGIWRHMWKIRQCKVLVEDNRLTSRVVVQPECTGTKRRRHLLASKDKVKCNFLKFRYSF